MIKQPMFQCLKFKNASNFREWRYYSKNTPKFKRLSETFPNPKYEPFSNPTGGMRFRELRENPHRLIFSIAIIFGGILIGHYTRNLLIYNKWMQEDMSTIELQFKQGTIKKKIRYLDWRRFYDRIGLSLENIELLRKDVNVLLVHDTFATQQLYREAFERLSLMGYNVIAFDRIGYGQSDKFSKSIPRHSKNQSLEIKAVAENVFSNSHENDVINMENTKTKPIENPLYIVCHGYGANVARFYAKLFHPEQLKGIIFIDPITEDHAESKKFRIGEVARMLKGSRIRDQYQFFCKIGWMELLTSLNIPIDTRIKLQYLYHIKETNIANRVAIDMCNSQFWAATRTQLASLEQDAFDFSQLPHQKYTGLIVTTSEISDDLMNDHWKLFHPLSVKKFQEKEVDGEIIELQANSISCWSGDSLPKIIDSYIQKTQS